jgi:hypothetical protein
MPLSRAGYTISTGIVALLVTCATVGIQRVGPTRMVTGEAWCKTAEPCAVRALGAGFPFAYLVDNPQISVPNAIGLVEDDFRAGAFGLDWLLFFLLLRPVGLLLARRRMDAPP